MEPRDEFRAKVARLVSHEAALMLTDIVGYTRLAEKEPKKALAILDEHNKLVDECVRKHSGIVARVLGDAYLVEFYSAIDAVRCALDIQVRLGARNVGLAEEKRILLRIGLHYATVKPVGQELRGEGIRLLPKVEARAAPGSVCLTEDVYDRIKGKAFHLEDLGLQSLEGWPEPEHLFLVSSPGPNPIGPQLPATQVPLAKESSLLQSVATLEPVPAISVRKPTAVRLAAAEDLDVRRSRAPWMFLMGVAVMAAVVAFVKLGTRTSSGEQSAAIPSEVPTARMAPPVEKEVEPAAKAAVEATASVVRPEAVASATQEKTAPPEKPSPAPAVNVDPAPASEGVAAKPPDDTLTRLQHALDRVEQLPEADQKRILPDLKDWRKVEKRMAAGKPGADVNRKVLASLEKQLDALGH